MNGGLLVRDHWRRHKCSPVRHMNGVGFDQTNVAINSGAAVPARGRLPRIVRAHRDYVLVSAKFEMAGQLVSKTDVAIRSPAEMKSVDPNVTVCHDAVEFDEDPATGIALRQFEVFAVPANTGRQKSA